jgi:hypothetical protein
MSKIYWSLTAILALSFVVIGQINDKVDKTKVENAPSIHILELRNYLLKPKSFVRFQSLFDGKFVEPMSNLGGYTLGQYHLDGEPDRFVWLRGFENMKTRIDFLNAFYLNNPIWKRYKPEANSMIINNDNVYLLRPLTESGQGISQSELRNQGPITVVDFYICNSTRDSVIDLFKKEYVPFLKDAGITDTSLWVSEMSENDFPRLPVFQDKNLLVTMTSYKSLRDYRRGTKQLNMIPAGFDEKMKELITVRNRWVLRSAVAE